MLAVRQPAGLGTAGAARCGCPPACGLSHPLFLFVVKMCFKAVRDASLTMLVSSRLVYSNQVVSVSFRAWKPPDVLRLHLVVKVRVPLFWWH